MTHKHQDCQEMCALQAWKGYQPCQGHCDLVNREKIVVESVMRTLIHHETTPDCCGCWNIVYDKDGLNAVCNECGKTLDLIAKLSGSAT
jgi:hypothetical protein